jgi:hypothetical protein
LPFFLSFSAADRRGRKGKLHKRSHSGSKEKGVDTMPRKERAEEIPNAETRAAMKEIEDMRSGKLPKHPQSVQDFMIETCDMIEMGGEDWAGYTMPDEIKGLVSPEFLQFLKQELKAALPDFLFENEEDWINLSSTGGWFKAFRAATQRANLPELSRHYNSLPWYDSDLFEAEIIDMAIEQGIITPLS